MAGKIMRVLIKRTRGKFAGQWVKTSMTPERYAKLKKQGGRIRDVEKKARAVPVKTAAPTKEVVKKAPVAPKKVEPERRGPIFVKEGTPADMKKAQMRFNNIINKVFAKRPRTMLEQERAHKVAEALIDRRTQAMNKVSKLSAWGRTLEDQNYHSAAKRAFDKAFKLAR